MLKQPFEASEAETVRGLRVPIEITQPFELTLVSVRLDKSYGLARTDDGQEVFIHEQQRIVLRLDLNGAIWWILSPGLLPEVGTRIVCRETAPPLAGGKNPRGLCWTLKSHMDEIRALSEVAKQQAAEQARKAKGERGKKGRG